MVYVKLRYPSGRIKIKKITVKARTLKGVQKEYLGTKEHFRTEAFPVAIVKKPIKISKKPIKRIIKKSKLGFISDFG